IVSFDPRDTPAAAAAKKEAYLARYARPGGAAGWHFLSGAPAAIDRVTKAAGFRYAWDADTKQFAHPTGVMVVTPDGRLARYLFLIAVAAFFSLLIATLIVFYAIKSRRRAPDEVGAPIHGSLWLEIGWTAIPLFIVMIVFVWGASVFFAMARPPDETLDIYV